MSKRKRTSAPLPPPSPLPSSRRKAWLLLLAALVGMGGGALYGTHLWQNREPPSPSSGEVVSFERTQAPFPLALDAQEVDSLLALADGYELGSAQAPVVLYEIVDFQCPACRRVAESFLPALKETYVEPGQVRLVLIDYPLPVHPQAEPAARAARCAERQGRFEEYQQILFQRQDEWGRSSNAQERFRSYAAELGVDDALFRGCQEDEAVGREVEANRALAERLSVPGTPAFVLQGEMLPASGEAVVAAIEEALDRQQGPVRGLSPERETLPPLR